METTDETTFNAIINIKFKNHIKDNLHTHPNAAIEKATKSLKEHRTFLLEIDQ